MKTKKLLVVFGTRPEAIKLAPVLNQLKDLNTIQLGICVTGQHREMLDQAMADFGLIADYDLDIMRSNQSLIDVISKSMVEVEKVINDFEPDAVVIHGDTNSTFVGGLAAFYSKIPLIHVESGLRSFDITTPFPEEAHRCMLSSIVDLHLAPSLLAVENLSKANVDKNKIVLTGNTIIDALRSKLDEKNDFSEFFSKIDFKKEIMIATIHRRENFGKNLDSVLQSITKIARSYDNLQIVIPVHPNPNIKKYVEKKLNNFNNIFLEQPLKYSQFIWLMNQAEIILTDSGGIQEEIIALRKKALILRDVTDRKEVLDTSYIKVVGTNTDNIVKHFNELYNEPAVECVCIDHSQEPYGKGNASQKTIDAIKKFLKL